MKYRNNHHISKDMCGERDSELDNGAYLQNLVDEESKEIHIHVEMVMIFD